MLARPLFLILGSGRYFRRWLVLELSLVRIGLLAIGLSCVTLEIALADDPNAASFASATVTTEHEAKHLANLEQVTFGLSRAGEGYFSPDGQWIVYQAYPVGYPFYQIYLQWLGEKTPLRLSPDRGGTTGISVGRSRQIPPHTLRLSPGRGRTTCSYFSPDGQTILFASSHTDPDIEQTESAARKLAKEGGRPRYQWDFDPHMEVYTIRPDATGLKRLTDSPGYDAEGSYSPDGKQIVFTSSRDGDPDLYLMNADGANVRQLTNTDGYDGGPFFSPDGQWVIFRSDRHKEHMLQLFIISVDGKREVQLTKNLDEVNWCPFFHPSGKYLIWSGADYSQGPRSANFNLFTLDLDFSGDLPEAGKVTQITDHKAADVLPVFSPDGSKLMWTSTRTVDGSSQLWIADWLRK
jgi:TolB protein